MRKRCRIAQHTFDIRFHHGSKWVSWFGGSTIFVDAHLTEVKGYIITLCSAIWRNSICPGDSPKNDTDCKCTERSLKNTSLCKDIPWPLIAPNCRTSFRTEWHSTRNRHLLYSNWAPACWYPCQQELASRTPITETWKEMITLHAEYGLVTFLLLCSILQLDLYQY